jgi:7,8-dihydropterin-6-yl-methyl-4-(beta-D-ribofuranosyl)aminobenzene 5'-phosphate synthase
MRGTTFVFVLILFLLSVSAVIIAGDTRPISLTILYDNYVHTPGTKADWGFACLIEGSEKTLLFDTGTKPEILMHNVGQLKVDIGKIDAIAISHNHGDHTGGLLTILKKKPAIPLYMPESFSGAYIEKAKTYKSWVIPVKEPAKICDRIYHTGEMGDQIPELSLILDTSKGLVLVQGCSHPGIVEMITRAKKFMKKEIYMVLGGFHLMRKSETELKQIIDGFKKLGVRNVGATHCTGDKAIAAFKKAYGKHYIPIGAGKKLSFE